MADGRDPNHYATLGVERSASTDEIRKAFQTLAKELHPDANPSKDAASRFQAAKEAYDVLRSDAKRQSYDAIFAARFGAPVDPYEAERLRRRAEAFDRNYKGEWGAGAGVSRLDDHGCHSPREDSSGPAAAPHAKHPLDHHPSPALPFALLQATVRCAPCA